MQDGCCPHALIDRLRDTAHGFAAHGAGYWPGAAHFLLLELDRNGSCTGEGHPVCRTCVQEAARCMGARLAARSGTFLDLVGVSEPDGEPESCCICGDCLS